MKRKSEPTSPSNFPRLPKQITPQHPHVRAGRFVLPVVLAAAANGALTKSEWILWVEVRTQMARSPDRVCYASNRTLGKVLRVLPRQVMKLLAALRAKGWVRNGPLKEWRRRGESVPVFLRTLVALAPGDDALNVTESDGV